MYREKEGKRKEGRKGGKKVGKKGREGGKAGRGKNKMPQDKLTVLDLIYDITMNEKFSFVIFA